MLSYWVCMIFSSNWFLMGLVKLCISIGDVLDLTYSAFCPKCLLQYTEMYSKRLTVILTRTFSNPIRFILVNEVLAYIYIQDIFHVYSVYTYTGACVLTGVVLALGIHWLSVPIMYPSTHTQIPDRFSEFLGR